MKTNFELCFMQPVSSFMLTSSMGTADGVVEKLTEKMITIVTSSCATAGALLYSGCSENSYGTNTSLRKLGR